jgi:hypothetical protein
LQDPSEANEDNLSDVRREASRHFKHKIREYLKDKITSYNQIVRIITSQTRIGA